MCLVGIAWCSHPQHRLVIAANRDEMHSRPTAAADWWPDAPNIYAGRDLEAQGTWLAVTADGRFAAVTNVFGSALIEGSFESRGHLITDYLNGDQPPGRFLNALAGKHEAYRPFRLAIGSPAELFIADSDGSNKFKHERVGPGFHALTNAPNGESWPKAGWILRQLESVVAEQEVDHARLINLLSTERMPKATDPENYGDEAYRFAPFIRNDTYGTRASTIVSISEPGQLRFTEQRYDSDGCEAGASSTQVSMRPQHLYRS